MNGQNPYRITCQWLDINNNTVYTFKSKSIWYNHEQFIRQNTIPVYIDPNNPKRHLVDIGFLPKSEG